MVNCCQVFAGSAGTLNVADPQQFTGIIGGISGSDTIVLGGFNSNPNDQNDQFETSTAYDGRGGYTTLTVTDVTTGIAASVTLLGYDANSAWSVTGDGNGGATVVDPPASSGGASGAALVPSPDVPEVIGAGASLSINTTYDQIVTFTGSTGSLVLSDPEAFSGQIVGFTGTAPNAAHSDTIDLVGINYDASGFSESYNPWNGVLTVTDGTHTAHISFDDFHATLDFASDGHGGTLITDPPSDSDSTASRPSEWGMKFDHDNIDFGQAQGQSADGANGQNAAWVSGDNFVFHANLGTETNGGANQNVIAEELQNHPNTQAAQQLTAIVTPEPHHEAFIDLVHQDAILSTGAAPAPWHQMFSGGFHLH